MEFVEDEPRPRFVFQSRGDDLSPPADITTTAILKTSKPHAVLCLLSATLLLLSALRLSSFSQTLSFILSWLSLSLFLGPFAPLTITGGDSRVGLGDPLPDPDPPSDAPDDAKARRKPRLPRAEPPPVADYVVAAPPENIGGRIADGEEQATEDREWNDEDLEILKKQMVKHPVGTARRWEMIAAAFGGRHGVKSVIATAKAMAERRPPGAGDSFQQFLRKRKPVDGRAEGGGGDNGEGGVMVTDDGKGEAVNWSSEEDLALLKALKAFPKDVAMRWEKIAAAVPGGTKASCMKRVAELKKDFRSSKASTEA